MAVSVLQLLVTFALATSYARGGSRCFFRNEPLEDGSCGWDHFIGTGSDPSNVFAETSIICCPKSDSGQDVVLCGDAFFKGTCIVTNIASGKYCANVEKENWASSVNTLGQCVRVYDQENCEGKSRSYYAGDSRAHDNLEAESMNDVVKSVGPCLDHDPHVECCERTSLAETLQRRGLPNYQMSLSNLLIVGRIAHLLERAYSDYMNPIQWVQRGPRGQDSRTEAVEAIIAPRHLGRGSATNQAARDWVTANGWVAGSGVGNRDDAGHVIGCKLGGSGTDLNNIFPQNHYANVRYYNRVERRIHNYVSSTGRAVRLTVNLEYASDATNRPFRLIYHAIDNQTGESIFTNVEIYNPERKVDYYDQDSTPNTPDCP